MGPLGRPKPALEVARYLVDNSADGFAFGESITEVYEYRGAWPGRSVFFTKCTFDDVVCAIINVYGVSRSRDRKRVLLMLGRR